MNRTPAVGKEFANQLVVCASILTMFVNYPTVSADTCVFPDETDCPIIVDSECLCECKDFQEISFTTLSGVHGYEGCVALVAPGSGIDTIVTGDATINVAGCLKITSGEFGAPSIRTAMQTGGAGQDGSPGYSLTINATSVCVDALGALDLSGGMGGDGTAETGQSAEKRTQQWESHHKRRRGCCVLPGNKWHCPEWGRWGSWWISFRYE